MRAADTYTIDESSVSPPPPIEVSDPLPQPVVAGPYRQTVKLAEGGVSSAMEAAYDTVLNNGPSSNRVDIVILGDGYTASQIDTTYVNHVNGMLEYLFNAGQDPYPRYAKFFNAHRINTISNESGADKPPNNIFVDTAFDAAYFCANIERLICVNTAKVNAAKNTALTGAGFTAEMQYVSVNDSKYGGSGGIYAVFAGANSSANELALHEVAHSFDQLADEYGGSPNYTGSEPSEVNVTTDPQGTKWQRWLGYDQPGIGTIDAYEGGRYYDQGIYRPSNNSKMRSLGRPFDAVSREKIILDIYDLVDPIDDWADNSETVQSTDPELWVQPIDLDVQDVQWSVDGVEVVAATDATFNLRDAGFGPGSYTVSARVYDPTDWVRHQHTKLEQTINWTVEIPPGPAVQNVQINQGEPTRSLVTSLDITFDTFVNVTPAAFVLTNRASQQPIALELTTNSSGSGTIAQLTFQAGDSILERSNGNLHSLVDGNYQITIVASEVTSVASGDPMDEDYRFGDQAADGFFRLFGDSDGDRDVDGQDYVRFGSAFLQGPQTSEFNPWFDLAGDGDVDGLDYGEFGRRFLKRLPF